MADFNTLSSADLIGELQLFGYLHLDTITESGSRIYYFEDVNVNSTLVNILKLTVDTTSYAYIYIIDESKNYKDDRVLLAETVVTDLDSLNTLLMPLYPEWDPMLLVITNSRVCELDNLITPSLTTYFNSTVSSTSDSMEYKLSEEPSPYRSRNVNWIPVVIIGEDWVLEYNNDVVVPTSAVVSNSYGDFVTVRVMV